MNYPVEERFKDHVATYFSDSEHLGAPIERLIWRKPGTGDNYIEYIAIGSSLIVRGDLYEAIYVVSGRKSLTWWTTTYPDYMANKMRDVRGGKAIASQKWDSDLAEKWLKGQKEELIATLRKDTKVEFESFKEEDGNSEVTWENWLQDHLDNLNEFDDRQRKRSSLENAFRLKFWNEYEPENYISDEADWTHFLHEHGDEIFGDPVYESGAYDCGNCRHPIIDVHNAGLKMAIKQLREKGVTLLEIKE